MGNKASAVDWAPILKGMCTEYEEAEDKIIPKELDRKDLKPVKKSGLGKGHFGVVKKCTLGVGQTKKQRRNSIPIIVACKPVKKAGMDGVLRGAAEMAQFGDMTPVNVVRLIGMVTKGSPGLLILEYCDSGSLDTFLIQRIGMSTADKLQVLLQVAEGMCGLEARKFVHGNLCLRNVLVTDGGQLFKVSDWGTPCTSPRRLAPEILATDNVAERMFTHHSDVWAYGMLAIEVLDDAKPAFSEAWDDYVVKQKVLDGYRPKKRDGCSDKVYELMTMCWSEDPEKRPHFGWLLSFIDDEQRNAAANQRRNSDPTLLDST
mmetsp:Transcript_10492/g.26957  ORF Transcript_10492/g.26957 Transcript_10492/m.26957 type:complete len:317 (+) Transcript_10492:376-1326(+)|eukprot:CAMPEP_0182951590 /NCGR_PEP_ID=MMETSP0105_2-20130417/61348_1 /TAXON_ID=81532 ORGANISM="Acanthoeca-like sp., Strain 10tr" /NCGR_SAMPLE_ID=MMETSP0105_2 /ASSEMBLY_ACC=CAM_ASM_000205 /LENGTH=316 /DNA_ID=CAMNT_0025091909 /DNA_START=357 /DNA_END=1307 /DNA_ORIENTATION=-